MEHWRMKPDRVLLKAAELVERGWCREWAAIDSQGKPCSQFSSSAVAWNIQGALEAAAGKVCRDSIRATRRLNHAIRNSGVKAFVLPVQWNDWPDHTAADVASMLRRAATTHAYPRWRTPSTT